MGLSSPLFIQKIEIYLYRAPIETPVKTSFGELKNRPALLVRLEDRDGASGWGGDLV